MHVRGVTPRLATAGAGSFRTTATLRFAQTPEPPEPSKSSPWWTRSYAFTRRVVGKVTSWERFKASVGNGYQESRADLEKLWREGSYGRIALRAGAEALGLVTAIVFLPFPGPNPAWLISPTGRTFIIGFMKETPADKPPAPPPAENEKPGPL